MDGNGRWATQRGMPRFRGHQRGAEVAKDIIRAAADLDIKILSLYAFSFENWQREASEVEYLIDYLLPKTLQEFADEANRNNIQLRIIGDVSRVPRKSRQVLDRVVADTSANTGLIVNVAISYSGRQEILQAVRKLVTDVQEGRASLNDLDEGMFDGYLQTSGLPDPDLHIRCGGVCRLSNLMLWQMAYTEQYSTDVLWPDFTVEDLAASVNHYHRQPRKFGKV